VARVNSDLVGKLVNIASRCAGFHQQAFRRPACRCPARSRRSTARFVDAADDIAGHYEAREYSKAMRGSWRSPTEANRYIDEHKPWDHGKGRGVG
jgi:methionyl-tRNA synthetase